MALRTNSNKKAQKNVYKKDINTNTKQNKIRSILVTKQNLEKKDNKEKYTNKELQRFYKTILGILLAICIFASSLWICYSLYQYALVSKYFAIKDIQYIGNNFLSDEELNSITKLELEKNILTYGINQIEVDLLENPWIENIRIRRSLPSTISIEIEEKEPVFWATKDDTLYYLDKNINFIAPVTKEKFILLPTIDIKYATQDAINSLPFIIEEIKNINLPFTFNEMLWFSINHAKGYEMFIEKYNLKISVEIKNWKKNIKNLAKVIDDLNNRNEINKIKEIHAAHNQVTVIKN